MKSNIECGHVWKIDNLIVVSNVFEIGCLVVVTHFALKKLFSINKAHRRCSISSLIVLQSSFHLGFKVVTTTVEMTIWHERKFVGKI